MRLVAHTNGIPKQQNFRNVRHAQVNIPEPDSRNGIRAIAARSRFPAFSSRILQYGDPTPEAVSIPPMTLARAIMHLQQGASTDARLEASRR